MDIRAKFSCRADVSVRAALDALVTNKRAVQAKVRRINSLPGHHVTLSSGAGVKLHPLVAGGGDLGHGEGKGDGASGCGQLRTS